MRKPTAKQIAKNTDDAIEACFYRTCSGVQVSVLDLGKIYAAGRAAIASGADLDAAIVNTVAVLRRN